MAKHTSITLGRNFESFIRKQVSGGRYATASEVVRAGLRMLAEEEVKLAALRASLDEGETSGFAKDDSLKSVLAEVTRKRR